MHKPLSDMAVSGPRAALLAYKLTGRIASLAGHLAAVILLLLALSIVLGITLRVIGIDNSWTYDLDNFSLIWLAFIGAAFTALRDGHVTAGISLEHMLGSRGWMLSGLRFVIVASFLILFMLSGYWQMIGSLATDERTLDVVQWPVWIAQAALPLGAVAWLSAEVHKLLHACLSTAS